MIKFEQVPCLLGVLIDLLKDFGDKGKNILSLYTMLPSNTSDFVKARVLVSAWLAYTGYDATALQLLTEAALFEAEALVGCSVKEHLAQYYDAETASEMDTTLVSYIRLCSTGTLALQHYASI